MAKRRPPVHPGEILKTEYLDELGITPYRLARDINVPVNRITMIVNGERSVSADTALRLARYFQTTPEFWLNLQMHYDLEIAKRTSRFVMRKEVPVAGAGLKTEG